MLFFIILIGGVALYIAVKQGDGLRIFTEGSGFWVGYFGSISVILNAFFKARNQAKENFRRHRERLERSLEKSTITSKGERIPVDSKTK